MIISNALIYYYKRPSLDAQLLMIMMKVFSKITGGSTHCSFFLTLTKTQGTNSPKRAPLWTNRKFHSSDQLRTYGCYTSLATANFNRFNLYVFISSLQKKEIHSYRAEDEWQ